MSQNPRLFTSRNRLRNHAKNLRQTMPDAEKRLWQHLRAGRLGGYKFRRQQPIGPYIADFVCTRPKLVIEADGGQHGEQQVYDAARSRYLQTKGFHVLRFWNHDILQQTEAVLTEILNTLKALKDE
ncbi:MAG: endonuclease domain-containing protein [Cardiobacteriaceae bacterium]|nr:endonuclease domain-containing protein [Cardiobacteriaceae bacterium]